MTLYSKNGSIPKSETDGTEGWVEVPDEPTAPEGKEVVWWSPPGWVIRDPMPVKEGFKYSWNQSNEIWVEHALEISSAESIILTTAESTITVDSISAATSNDTITITG
jgi:hypothetical protein